MTMGRIAKFSFPCDANMYIVHCTIQCERCKLFRTAKRILKNFRANKGNQTSKKSNTKSTKYTLDGEGNEAKRNENEKKKLGAMNLRAHK